MQPARLSPRPSPPRSGPEPAQLEDEEDLSEVPLPPIGLETVVEEDSLARLAQDLEQEVHARVADVATLRTETSTQSARLNQLAEQVLGADALALLDGARRDELVARDELVVIQQHMELQAAALREGLMDIQHQRSEIQQQRAALVALAERLDQVDGDAGQASITKREGSEVKATANADNAVAALRQEVSEVRESLGCLMQVCFGADGNALVSAKRDGYANLAEAVTPRAADPVVAALRREVSEVRETLDSFIKAKRDEDANEAKVDADNLGESRALALRKEFAEELAHLATEIEHRCQQVSEALGAECFARQAEARDMRVQLQSCAERLEHRAMEELRCELKEQSTKQAQDQELYVQDVLAVGVQRAEMFERQLLAQQHELEERAVSRCEVLRLSEEGISAALEGSRGEAALQLAQGAHAESASARTRLEELGFMLMELDSRQEACVARLTAEMGQLASDYAQRGSNSGAAEDYASLRDEAHRGDVLQLSEELQGTRREVQRFCEELQDFKTRSLTCERSVSLELERLASVVDAAPWTASHEDVTRSLQDAAGLRGDMTLLYQQMEAAEVREKALRDDVSVCMQLGQEAAAKLPLLAAQLEQTPEELANDIKSRVMLHSANTIMERVKPKARAGSLGRPTTKQPKSTVDTLGATVPEIVTQRTTALAHGAVTGPSLAAAPSAVQTTIAKGSTRLGGSLQMPVTQANCPCPPPLVQTHLLKTGLVPHKDPAIAQLAATPRGCPHSVPAALHGLTEAARALRPGAARRKALVVGCSYYSSQVPLRGTLNDAWNVLSLLRHSLQYAEDQVRFLIDGSEHMKFPTAQGPAKASIAEGLDWLAEDAKPGDELFFYFCGYGTQRPVGPQGELCEAYLVPADFAEGVTTDGYRLVALADISRALARLPPSCKVTVVLDCCFSLLPGVSPCGNAQPAVFTKASMKYPPPVQGDMLQPFASRTRYLELMPVSGQPAVPLPGAVPEPACLVHCYSACEQPQWCVEIPIEGVVQGAFTWAWVKALISVHLEARVAQLCTALAGIMAELKEHYPWLDQTAVVQLSSSAKIREGQPDETSVRKLHNVPVLTLPSNHRRRKALLVGINYADSHVAHAQLKGCLNDAWNVHSILRHTLQYGEDQIRLLVDGEHGLPAKAAQAPTKANIVVGLNWLVSGARPGDCLFFLFCGYGAQHPRGPGTDDQEAYLVPSDFAADVSIEPSVDASTPTTSSSVGVTPPVSPVQTVSVGAGTKGYRLLSLLELNRFVAQLPSRSSLTMVLDCAYPAMPGLAPTQTPTFPRVSRGRVDYRKLHDFVSRPRFLELPQLPVQHTPDHIRAPISPDCQLHCFSACRLEEWGCELPLEGTVQGAFTWAFTKALAAGHYKSTVNRVLEALQRITGDLKQHFKGVAQTPVLLLSRTASGENVVLGS